MNVFVNKGYTANDLHVNFTYRYFNTFTDGSPALYTYITINYIDVMNLVNRRIDVYMRHVNGAAMSYGVPLYALQPHLHSAIHVSSEYLPSVIYALKEYCFTLLIRKQHECICKR
jgi:hypothetical protein